MQRLNFPAYHFRLKNSENKHYIFDVIRKKFVILQPEEWVRQHTVHFLITEKKYPKTLVNVEKTLWVHTQKKRYDIVVFRPDGSIRLLVECKRPEVTITQHSFDQIARYNLALRSDYLMVTNGLTHYYCKMDYDEKQYVFLKEIPSYGD